MGQKLASFKEEIKHDSRASTVGLETPAIAEEDFPDDDQSLIEEEVPLVDEDMDYEPHHPSNDYPASSSTEAPTSYDSSFSQLAPQDAEPLEDRDYYLFQDNCVITEDGISFQRCFHKISEMLS